MMGTDTLATIQTALGSREGRLLARSILGTEDPASILGRVEGFCGEHGLSDLRSVVFLEISVGATFGLLLADGSRVVLKAHPAGRDAGFLRAACHVQRRLFENRFPCPRPILGPAPLGGGSAVVEAFLDRGERADAHEPRVRRAMARALARQISLSRDVVPGAEDLRLDWAWPADTLWPTPHNALFDFGATAAGAGWIDGVAAAAKAVVDASEGPPVVGHADWSAKHFRFEGGRVRAVYDWDSLRLDKEAVIVGGAAATFPATWYLPVESLAPSPGEMRLFLDEYEGARGVPFSAAEREAVVCAAVYALAYAARCEHARRPGMSDLAGGFREALRGHRDDYLRLADDRG